MLPLIIILQKKTTGPSIFEITQRDADRFVPRANPQLQFEDDDDTFARPAPARVYWTCIRIVFWISVFLCLWPFSCICLFCAHRSSTRVQIIVICMHLHNNYCAYTACLVYVYNTFSILRLLNVTMKKIFSVPRAVVGGHWCLLFLPSPL